MGRDLNAPIPAHFLQKDGQSSKEVTLLDAAVLLMNVHRGSLEPLVGFEDCRDTLQSLTKRMTRNVWYEQATLESALWSSNLLDEQGKFWCPKGRTFDQFLADIIGPGFKFNKMHNLISKKDKS